MGSTACASRPRAGGQPSARARLLLQAAERIEPDGMQMTWLVTVEREGSDKARVRGRIAGAQLWRCGLTISFFFTSKRPAGVSPGRPF